MKVNQSMMCPKCNGNHFVVKREATYVYTYKINTTDAESCTDKTEALPYLFDSREETDSTQYLECQQCRAHYPCSIDSDDKGIKFIIMQKAIRSDHTTKPEFLG